MTRLTKDFQISKTILYYTVMYYIMMDTCHYAYVKTSSMSPNANYGFGVMMMYTYGSQVTKMYHSRGGC